MYPLKFQPVFQQRIWGGNQLRSVLNKNVPSEWKAVGESWELADLPPGTVKKDSVGANADGSLASVIANGPWQGQTLHDVLTEVGFAKTVGHFPLLIKFLDAQTDLSVQVHPDDAFCAANPGSHLKSEAWYVMHAQPGAKIYKGVKPGVTRQAFHTALQNGAVEPLLQAIPVKAGDCHYLRSGTVHALGAGILAAEVQTPSDTTFRVFDWNRLGPDGKPRALHVEQAMACINFETGLDDGSGPRSQYSEAGKSVSRLVTCDYFSLDRASLSGGKEYPITESQPVVWIVLEGQGVITCGGAGPTAFTKGDTLLLAGNMQDAKVMASTTCSWLETKLPAARLS